MPPESRILVCDDESQTVRALRFVLRGAGFEVEATTTAGEALERAALRAPDAVILEMVLSDADGADVCRRVREWSTMPLIVLSALSEEEHKVRALEAGADDYLTKPFAPGELVARLRGILRRTRGGGDQPQVELDGLEIDLAERQVLRHGQEVHLTPTEFRLLRLFVHNLGRLITHRSLLRQVWGAAYKDDRQRLRTHIANLGRKLEAPEGLSLIATQRGIGYAFGDQRDSQPHVMPGSDSAVGVRLHPIPPSEPGWDA